MPNVIVEKNMARYSKEERLARARTRAKQTVYALINASNGRLVGKLRLYKAFYKAHLEYFEATGLDLTGYPMVHMPNGPGIDNAQELIDELMDEGLIREEIGTPDRPKERVYTCVGQMDEDADDERAEAIRSAVAWANALDEEALKDGSHNRSWNETLPGEAQNIFLDAVPEDRLDGLRNDLEKTAKTLKDLAARR